MVSTSVSDSSSSSSSGTASGACSRNGWLSTQVSLLPPPWLLFTTISPLGRATRVRPPGSTQTSSPLFTANGRRSTCRGSSPEPIRVGTVESCTSGWAIQPRGSASTRARSASSSSAVATGPITMPLPPEPSTGLTTSSANRSITSSRAASSSSRQVSTLRMIGSSRR